jgi:hypothetical protein
MKPNTYRLRAWNVITMVTMIKNSEGFGVVPVP